MPSPPLYVALIGGANVDISAKPLATLVAGDSNPGRIACSPGGVARNVAENLLRLGVDARLVSVLGDDLFAQLLRHAAAGIGLNLQACASLAGARTATYLSVLDRDGDMGVAVNDMDILEQLTPERLSSHAELLQGAAAIMLDCNLRPDSLAWLAAHFQHKPLFAEAVSTAKCRKLQPLMAQLHTLKLNRMEAAALSAMPVSCVETAQGAALALHRQGVRNVVISLGAQGAVWCDADGLSAYRQAQAVQMVSATGAGDAMLAGLMHAYLEGLPLSRAVAWAMACAELTLSSTFANSPHLSLARVRARLNEPSL